MLQPQHLPSLDRKRWNARRQQQRFNVPDRVQRDEHQVDAVEKVEIAFARLVGVHGTLEERVAFNQLKHTRGVVRNHAQRDCNAVNQATGRDKEETQSRERVAEGRTIEKVAVPAQTRMS